MEQILARLKGKARLQPDSFSNLAGWYADDIVQAHSVFSATCRAILGNTGALRTGTAPPKWLARLCKEGLVLSVNSDPVALRKYYEINFRPCLVMPEDNGIASTDGFATGYYEPEVAGSFTKSGKFSEPLLGLPAAHQVLDAKTRYPSLPSDVSTALKMPDGTLTAYPDRAAITSGTISSLAAPLLWVRDGVEAFMIHVQGSARIRLQNGKLLRLKYAGRNGHPYTSIGKKLVQKLAIPPSKVSMTFLKDWIRAAGQNRGEPGRLLMEENQSYIFFQLDLDIKEDAGPIGAAGISLSPLRSLAVDRNLWPYGLLFWIDAELPWKSAGLSPFRRLMVAQDTGSAILGPARGDIFFGSGAKAGELAGAIRHPARFHVLLPR
jgi:membrane-bound lytic murein transglycosylase A